MTVQAKNVVASQEVRVRVQYGIGKRWRWGRGQWLVVRLGDVRHANAKR